MRFSRWVMRSRTRRRSISSLVSPGAAAADATRQPGERIVALGQPGEHVLELGQLDLKLAVGALGPLGEDVEDELGAVEDLEAGLLGDVPRLRRIEVAVEDQEVRPELHRLRD